MRISSDEGFVLLIAKDDAEKALFQPIADAINSEDPELPAQIVDNLENGADPKFHRFTSVTSSGDSIICSAASFLKIL